MNEKELTAGVARIGQVFDVIKAAAMLLTLIEPQRILTSWERQETILPFLDATAYQAVIAQRKDLDRKKRLITAARDFLNEWEAVNNEVRALSARPEREGRQGVVFPPGRGPDEEDAAGNDEGA